MLRIALILALTTPAYADRAPLPSDTSTDAYEPGGTTDNVQHAEDTPAPYPHNKHVLPVKCTSYLSGFVNSIGKVNPFAEHEHDYEKPLAGNTAEKSDHAATLIERHCADN